MEDCRFFKEIALALSGGGSRGGFHLGVLSVLEEYGVQIKAISGTSIGALVAVLYASGYRSGEIVEILKSKEFKKIFKLHFKGEHIFKIDFDSKYLKNLIRKKSFEELDIPVILSVCNIEESTVSYVAGGDSLMEYVAASCSIVPILQPIKIGENIFADGGLIDNFPVEQLKKFDYPIVGINLFPQDKMVKKSLLGWLNKIIHIAWQTQNYSKKDLCDIYITHDKLNTLNMFSFKEIDKAYKLGREEARKYFENTTKP